ncbi:extracellular solute-binding protein [Anaerocolumna sp. AGMB13025]|uniref:ABC transporter substrate-binding protein n=1 Tax=Anaerocolumna sp. AGMB13025 TaxID=3039116 RepID=UPI00241FFEF4|nr:extracellular solute-binding protein [Anaerocolumna sp. AGMB13025]WFR57418.1 extracellular solute-binding protein [Anaerocolumna sp. AGMB13025]
MKKQSVVLMIFMVCFLAILTGCSQKEEQETGSTNNGKGRYLEESLKFPEEITESNGIAKQENGSYLCFDIANGLYESIDKGKTWIQKKAAWREAITSDFEIAGVAISTAGEFAVTYYPKSKGDDSNLPLYKYIAADGSMVDLSMEPEKEYYMPEFTFSDDGRLFCCGSGGKIYEVDKKTGSFTKILQGDNAIDYMRVAGNSIVAVYRDRKSLIYDLKLNQKAEADMVLDRFLQDTTKVEAGYRSYANAVLIIPGIEENSIYLACKGGLFYHILGGSVMEQVIDGNLSTFGNPSDFLLSMMAEEGGTFLVLYNKEDASKELIRYAYDETVPAVPDTELKLYSLEDNQTVRQAISQYQKDNPDVYLSYTLGMDGAVNLSKEEALKTLNTEILAGNGPDILIMDDIFLNTYADKGVLLDLSSLLKEIEADSELFNNITEACRIKDKVYAIPAKFMVPVIAGESRYVDGITGLPELAATVKEIRAQKTAGNILGIYTEKELLKLLAIGCAPSWLKEDGTLDQGSLKEFLSYAKQIYETEKQGITPTMEKDHQENDYYLEASTNALHLLAGELVVDCGYMKGIDMGYSALTSLFHTMDKKGTIKSLKLQSHNVFLPRTIAAVNSKTANPDKAKEFIKVLLSEQLQTIDLGDGFPVNKTSFEKQLTDYMATGEDTDHKGTLGMDGWNGDTIILEIEKLSGQEADNLRSLINNLSTPDIADSIIIDSITELGPAALNGEKSIEEVATEIINKLEVRLKE